MGEVRTISCPEYDFKLICDKVAQSVGDYANDLRGKKILVKPNLLAARAPEEHITTHPYIVEAVIHILKSCGAIPVIGDSHSTAEKYDDVITQTGMLDVARRQKVEIVNFVDRDIIEYKVDGFKIVLTRFIKEIDGIVSLPKFKTHSLTVFTGAIKNLYGLVPGLLKTEYHRIYPLPYDFSLLLAKIYKILRDKLKFTVMDAIIGMDGNGPANGRVKKLGFIMVSDDVLAMDTAFCHLINLKSHPLLEFCYDGQKINIKMSGEKIVLHDFHLPSTPVCLSLPLFITRKISNLLNINFYIKIDIEKCKKCRKCMDVCPESAIIELDKGMFILQSKCIKCTCCNEVCPHNAVLIKETFMVKVGRKLHIF